MRCGLVLSLFVGLTAFACGAGEGEECAKDNDCASGLACSHEGLRVLGHYHAKGDPDRAPAAKPTCETVQTINCRKGDKSNCSKKGHCYGRPDATQRGHSQCMAKSSRECRYSQECYTEGRCNLNKEKGVCAALTVKDCSGGVCKTYGKCAFDSRSEACFAQSTVDCKNSYGCKGSGRCMLQGRQCVATAEGCRASTGCKHRRECRERHFTAAAL